MLVKQKKEFISDLIYIVYSNTPITMKNLHISFLILVSVVGFWACTSDTTQDLSALVTDPTYTRDIQPIMSVACTNCHSNGDQFPDLDSYTAVKNAAEQGELVCRVQGSCNDIMPPDSPLPSNTVTMIGLWRDHGCPEN